MTQSTIMHENLADVDSHVEHKLALQQINIFLTICGGSWRQKLSPAVSTKEIAPKSFRWGSFTVGVVDFSS